MTRVSVVFLSLCCCAVGAASIQESASTEEIPVQEESLPSNDPVQQEEILLVRARGRSASATRRLHLNSHFMCGGPTHRRSRSLRQSWSSCTFPTSWQCCSSSAWYLSCAALYAASITSRERTPAASVACEARASRAALSQTGEKKPAHGNLVRPTPPRDGSCWRTRRRLALR